MDRRDFIKKIGALGLSVGAAENILGEPVRNVEESHYDMLYKKIEEIQARLSAIEKVQSMARIMNNSRDGFGGGHVSGGLNASTGVYRNHYRNER